MVPDALANFGACPVVSVRLMTAPPIARRLSNMSCRIGSSGCGSGGSREIEVCSSADANGIAMTKLDSIQHIEIQFRMVDLLFSDRRPAGKWPGLLDTGTLRAMHVSSKTR